MLGRRVVLAGLSLTAISIIGIARTVFAQDSFFDSNGVRLRYVEQGTGTPVVLLHGNGGSLATWVDSGRFREFAASYRTIAFDFRGHGQSDKPRDPRQYGRELALDVVRVLDHLRIDRAHVVGYSLGGIVASQLVTLHPERVLTATLVAGVARREWNEALAKETEEEAAGRERECIARLLILRNAPPGEAPSEADLNARSATCFADRNQDRFAMAALTRSRSAQIVSPSVAAAVRVPTLGIVGTLDPNRAGLEALKAMRPDMKLVLVDGATHGGERGILTRSELMPAIRAFLSGSGTELPPEPVVVPSGTLRLDGLVWRPAGSGRFPAILFSHGNSRAPSNANILGPVFARRGFVFLYLYRRGSGPSADQGPFFGDLVDRERRTNGADAAERLAARLLVTDLLDDTSAGVGFLRSRPEVDPRRVAVVGHSQGGQLALLIAERDPSLRAVVSFAAAAQAWDNATAERRQTLLTAAAGSDVPAFMIHAANDYSVAPGRALEAEMTRVGRRHRLVIAPPVGQTAEDGHNLVHLAVPVWEGDVFGFLDKYMMATE